MSVIDRHRQTDSSSQGSKPNPHDPWRHVLRLLGAGLLIVAGAVHLDLYLTGYHSIPTIGVLFLLQIITSAVLAALLIVSTSRLVAAAGAGFVLSVLGGYLISLRMNLFGFREIRTGSGIFAGIVEIVAFGLLAEFALAPDRARHSRGSDHYHLAWFQARPRFTVRARQSATVLSVVVTALLVVSLAATPPKLASSVATTQLRSLNIQGTHVLTDSRGLTLYWFSIDTPTKSNCYGSCSLYWPQVTGTPSAGAGVTGSLGTLRRTNGEIQVTYNGHPLYLYIGDDTPGQNNGNNLDINGGHWSEATA